MKQKLRHSLRMSTKIGKGISWPYEKIEIFFFYMYLDLAYLIGLGFKVSFFYCDKNKVKVKKIISLSGKRQSEKSVSF